MGLVNTVVPLERLEQETVAWCREMLALSPFSLRLLKASFNAAEDGLAGHPAARARRQPAVLRQRGGPGGPRRVQARSARRTSRASPSGPSRGRRPHLGDGGARCARCRRRSRRCSSAPRWRSATGHFHPLAFVAALLGAMFIQVGTNLSNDYSDARRGADTEDRLGPVRVTAGGLVPPQPGAARDLRDASALAVACGAYLVAVAGWELLAVGAASILAGVLYTGGPRPYGYEGLGEVFVFLFFGIVAVAGSYFVQVQQLPWQAFVLRGPGRPAGERDPRRQQRARHRDRPPRGQAHARRAPRPRAHARRCTRRCSAAAFVTRAAAVGRSAR